MVLFARKVAHDINNFSTVVRTYSELLLADLPPGTTHADVTEIHRAADATVTYLQRVVRFSRVANMRPTEQPVMSTVHAIVEELAEARERAVLRLGGSSETPVSIDAAWLREVVRELVVNAREAAPAGSTVLIDVRDDADVNGRACVVIDVQDQGPGFAAVVAVNAEDPFVSTKDNVRGAGFGLTIAAAFADAGGNALIRSRVGETTHVALWLRV